ncbi:isoamyl acetate-hydrolyzing esterase [Coemansia sp. Cherry 401B]|nr:isoamyl acetate-hydrolyzing esterase [Coemansia sp. RSA 2610]KAJ2735000.1 isoamyl acetate-hydrolyzing esterase [Coemansia sp. Cherry 401B]
MAVFLIALSAFNYLLLTSWASGRASHSPYTANNVVTYAYNMYDVLLIFGDSHTQYAHDPDVDGFVALLARLYQRQMDVLNRGFSGYNTTGARRIVHTVLPLTSRPPSKYSPAGVYRWVSNYTMHALPGIYNRTKTIWPDRDYTFPDKPGQMRLCIIFFGTNDATIESSSQHTPLDQFADNLRYFVSLLNDPSSPHYSPTTKILFITPPPTGDRMVEEKARLWDHPITAMNNSTKKYADMVRKVANEVDAPYVDLYARIEALARRARRATPGTQANATVDFEGYDRYLIDGVHLNGLGNQLLYNMLRYSISFHWPELFPDTPPRAVAPWPAKFI